MKKGLIILFGLLLLIGCSNNNDANQPQQDNADQNNVEQNNVEQNESSDVNNGVANETEPDTDNATVTDSDANNDHLKDFQEFDVLAKELDLNAYEGIVESDNKGNRIILFQDADGKKEFKSIFVKHDNRLKIVQFDNEDDLLYNDVIK